jgi:leukotriene-A4 hydrolase
LTRSIEQLKKTPELTALVPDLAGVDPDDSFSSVPYEKGFALLFYLENLLGGATVFDPYLRAHFTNFSSKSIDTDDFKSFLYTYMGENHPQLVAKLDTVDWLAWFKGIISFNIIRFRTGSSSSSL